MAKKLLFLIAIAVCLISACVPIPTGAPQGGPTGEPGNGTTPPPVTVADQWSGWAQVPGGGTTDVALAATVFNSKLYLFGKGINDKREYVNTYDTAGNWGGWAQVPGGGTTDASLAPVVFNNKIYLFGKGIDDKREYVNTFGPTGN
jgi:hypothetical protein